MIEAQVWQRVVRLVGESGRHGTGTIIDHDGEQFLVTAKHLCIPEDAEQVTITHVLSNAGAPFSLVLRRVGSMDGDADVAAFRLPDHLVSADLALPVGSGGLVYSQEAYILGYPFGIAFKPKPPSEQQFAIVKRCLVSGAFMDGNVLYHYVDAIANPGFSGGPMIYFNHQSRRLTLGGIVKGQLLGPMVEALEGEVPSTYFPSGISQVIDVEHVRPLLTSEW